MFDYIVQPFKYHDLMDIPLCKCCWSSRPIVDDIAALPIEIGIAPVMDHSRTLDTNDSYKSEEKRTIEAVEVTSVLMTAIPGELGTRIVAPVINQLFILWVPVRAQGGENLVGPNKLFFGSNKQRNWKRLGDLGRNDVLDSHGRYFVQPLGTRSLGWINRKSAVECF